MINRHRISLAVAAVIMLAVACTESIDRRIVLADSLSIALPDSAMKIMDRIDPAKEGFTKQQAMRYELIRAKVQNRAFIDFTTDSVMREVADYYDRHGTIHERTWDYACAKHKGLDEEMKREDKVLKAGCKIRFR